MNKEQIINEVYNKYLTKYMGYDDVPSKELFLFEIKNNPEFSEKWGLKIEERELSLEERYNLIEEDKHTQFVNWQSLGTDRVKEVLDKQNIPTRTREPYSLPTLNINTEFWPTESGECGIGGIDAAAVFHPDNVHFYKCLLEEDIQLSNYQSHPTIKAQLSN